MAVLSTTALAKLRIPILLGLFFSVLLGVILTSGNVSTPAATPPTDTSASSLTQGTQKTVLENGLTVLTKEIHTAPVVSVQIWYRVGSRNEAAGRNGISHQLEHLMFKGTVDRPIQFGRFFSALGSQFNAFTSYDETAYFNTLESNKLDAVLVLEADRMEKALIGAEQLDSERKVVISELQGYENRPSYRLNRAVMKAVFPNHPYGLPVGGTIADVQKFNVDAVKDYYQTYYSPNNATLVITGDFSTASVLKKVRDTFGRLPKQPGSASSASAAANPTRESGQPASGLRGSGSANVSGQAAPGQAAPGQSPIVLREPGSAALLQVVYPLPDIKHPDVPAIDLMDIILTGGRSSRFYQALVESGVASGVTGFPAELIDKGWYSISVTAASTQAIHQAEQVLQKALATVQQQPVGQEELDRAKTQLKSSFVLANQDITSQANQLAYNQVETGDYKYSDRYLAAIDRLTTADIQRVAKVYLAAAKQTVGFFEPTTVNGRPGVASASAASRTSENFSPGKPVDPAEVARYLPPFPEQPNSASQALPNQITLNNGLKVLLLPDSSTPMVNLRGWVEAGASFDGTAKSGLANLTADNLLNGTQTKDALTLAKELEDEGASLSFTTAREGVSFSGYALTEKLPSLIQTLADVLQQSTFPANQLELTRQRALTVLKMQLDDPQQLSWRVFRQTLYPPNHPFQTFPTEDSLKSITQADVVQFYKTHYRPDTTLLSLVGRFDPEQVRSLLNRAFEGWKAEGSRPVLQFPPVSPPKSIVRVTRPIPGKTESVTFLGYSGGIARKDPRFYPALVLNEIVGGNTLASRLGTEVRDRQGLTYGINSFFQAGINPGPFAIVMQTAPQDTDKAINSTLALLQQIQTQGVTEAELETAKRSLTSSYPVDLADPGNVATTILNNSVYGLSPDEVRQFPQQIEAVTLDQIKQVTKDLIHPENLLIVTAGPGNGGPTGG